jgi:hypothetical protein
LPDGRGGGARLRRRAGVWLYLAAGLVAAAGLAVLVWRSGPTRPAEPFPFPCLGSQPQRLDVHPYLRIIFGGRDVPIPAGIGVRDPVYRGGTVAGGSCFEPLHTRDGSGVIHLAWSDPGRPFTLGDFFAVWRATYPTVRIDGEAFPVDYTGSELLGHREDARHFIELLVDYHPSDAGPALVLNGLDHCTSASAGPPCAPTAVRDPRPPELLRRYGAGHVIILEYVPR